MTSVDHVEERPRFCREQPFRRELQRRVDAHFRASQSDKRGGARMLAKAAVLLAWLVLSYLALVLVAATWWQAVLAAASLALAIAAAGMGIHHDANHGAFSQRRWVNRLFARTLDLLGVSSYHWSYTHNIFHHTYTNIDDLDQDLDIAPLARLAPTQPRRWFHAYQHLYMWILYGFTLFYFVLAEDAIQLWRSRRGPNCYPPARGAELGGVLACKLFVVGWSVVVPMFYHPWWLVLLVLATVWTVAGFLLGFTFQVAHCGEHAAFFPRPVAGSRMPDEWAVHQVKTTANFASGRPWISFLVGGLNYQIEHHLFPRICHIHYPALAPIVKRTCRDFGIDYTEHPRIIDALRAHGRWLRAMGRPPAPVPDATPAADVI